MIQEYNPPPICTLKGPVRILGLRTRSRRGKPVIHSVATSGAGHSAQRNTIEPFLRMVTMPVYPTRALDTWLKIRAAFATRPRKTVEKSIGNTCGTKGGDRTLTGKPWSAQWDKQEHPASRKPSKNHGKVLRECSAPACNTCPSNPKTRRKCPELSFVGPAVLRNANHSSSDAILS